jgi:antitoxin ParD1/3/4
MGRAIRTKVASGAYGSNSEVIRDALRGWLERDRRFTALDTAIANGIADAAGGCGQSADDVRADLHKRLRKKSPAQSAAFGLLASKQAAVSADFDVAKFLLPRKPKKSP